MSGALEVAAIGMRAQQSALETIASNISNVNTPGYKRSELRFSELVASDGHASGAADRVAGVTHWETPAVNRQGQLYVTGNSKDLAINGAGFVELMGPAGRTLLWRGGTLQILDDGQLATASGLPLKANLTVPTDATSLTITADGKVFAQSASDQAPVTVGTIALVKVADGAEIERLDGGVYALTDSAKMSEVTAGEDGAGLLVQASLERSNVDLNSEMVDLLISQRAYAANAQVVRAADEFYSVANGLRR